MPSIALQQAMVLEDAVKRAAGDRHDAGNNVVGGNKYYSYAEGLNSPEDVFLMEVRAFPQVWGSTALGFKGIGGQMITSAMTTVVSFRDSQDPSLWAKAYVYFGGRFAYSAHPTNGDFIRDLEGQTMPAVGDHDYNMEPA